MQRLQLNRIRFNKTISKFELKPNLEYIVGRNQSQAQIVINSETISRKHAKIIVTKNGSASIQDLDSANGTFIDGNAIKQNQIIILKVDQEIQFGKCTDIIKVVQTQVNKSRSRSNSPKQEKVQQELQKNQQVQKLDKNQQKKLLWGKKDQINQPWKALDIDNDEKIKFMKLMGVKNVEQVDQQVDKNLEFQDKQIQGTLEQQFYQSIQRKDGFKRGLGYN